MLCAKQLFRAVNRGLLDNVSPLAAAIVALLWITFGVLVGEDGASGFQDGFADKSFPKQSTRDRSPAAQLRCQLLQRSVDPLGQGERFSNRPSCSSVFGLWSL